MKLYKNDIFKDSDTFFNFSNGLKLFKEQHDHDYYEIFIVLNGAITHNVNQTIESVSQYEAVFVHKNDFHVLSGDKESEVLNIAFSSSLFSQMINLFDSQLNAKKILLNACTLNYYLDEMRVLTSYADLSRSEISLKAILTSLLGHFISNTSDSKNTYPQWFQNFLLTLEQVDVFTSDMNEVYSHTPKTPAHISRTFQKYMKVTLTAYLLSLKTNYAMRLLTTTDLPILDVCFEAGFHNLGYFYRCFNVRYGMTPQKYKDLYHIDVV